MSTATATKGKKITVWAISLAACAAITFGIYASNQNSTPEQVTSPPTIGAKQQVNIDGVIEEVGADGKSFRIGDLWVSVNENTTYGISGPTAPDPSEQLVSKEFKVGNTVSGFTSEDVASGKVTANAIYNNF